MDYNIIEVDFADVERRIAMDKALDLHTQRAAQEFGVPPADVTPAQRRYAKHRNFYDIYGNPSPYIYQPTMSAALMLPLMVAIL